MTHHGPEINGRQNAATQIDDTFYVAGGSWNPSHFIYHDDFIHHFLPAPKRVFQLLKIYYDFYSFKQTLRAVF